MKTDKEKISDIKKYLKNTRKNLDECIKNDCEYTTTDGNGTNCCEASSMFQEVENEIGNILKS